MSANKPNTSYKWPKKAVVTAGMPYGNKALHFGHVGGVFVPADCFATFLKDRIGYDNVLFISGTDCYGSPIDEGYRKAVENGQFSGTIEDYVKKNHDDQANTLKKFYIDLSIFEGSGIGLCGDIHKATTDDVLETLHDKGWLMCNNSKQFYDTQANMFLNGRQVHGRCPVQGCKSEDAYADECSLGHQYSPEDLIAPKSSVTSTVPEMRDVKNWYFDLPSYRQYLIDRVNKMKDDENIREVVSNSIAEFLAEPIIFIKNECEDDYKNIAAKLPQHEYKAAEGNKQSFTIAFNDIYDRDNAKEILTQNNIRFRTGKTLVPFRLTGNAAWGVKSPDLKDLDGTSSPDLTVWCWPESLWAPISFTKAAIEKRRERDVSGCGAIGDAQNSDVADAGANDIAAEDAKDSAAETTDTNDASWKDFWCSDDATVYQFIGQDNIYFYGVAQPALFDALANSKADNKFSGSKQGSTEYKDLKQTRLVANHHVLFGKTKASSSGEVKPPSADELLDYYTPEQLRAHWLALGLSQKSVGFSPKPFDPDEQKRNDPRVADPVLKEGALLTNVFNRLARSCFYECASNFDCDIPLLKLSDEAINLVVEYLDKYESTMQKVELHSIMRLMDEYLRKANKYWADNIAQVAKSELEAGIDVRQGGLATGKRQQVLADTFYLLYAGTLMMHPVVPFGCEKIADMMNVNKDVFFNWENIYIGLNSDNVWKGIFEYDLASQVFNVDNYDDLKNGIQKCKVHKVKKLPPKTDFFKKHKSQYK